MITVCIPAYRSGAFISDTLLSLQAQTFPHFQALISIDGNDEMTWKQCQPFLKDSRYKIFVQETQLGWIQNTNWLLTRIEGRFVSILPHDDLLHPYYLEELLRYQLQHPQCALVYCDTEAFSDDPSFCPFYFVQSSLKGPQFKRMHSYLMRNFEAPGFRSLISKWALDAAGLLDNRPFEDFAADTLWLGKIAKQGELHRLPYPLCRKRYHGENIHLKWFKETKEHQRLAWKLHCSDLLDAFMQKVSDSEKKQQLINAAAKRFKRGCSRFFLVLLLVLSPSMGAVCKEPLTSAIFPRTDPQLVGLVYRMLYVVDLLFTQHEIPYWIDGGTALGAVRHQGMIPWDDDADLVFFMKDEQRISALAGEFASYGLYLKKESIFRLYPSQEKRYPFIDIAGYSLYPDNTLRFHAKNLKETYERFYWLPEEVASLKRVPFGPIELNAPSDMMRYLFAGYGADCMSMATFQTLHGPAKHKVVIKKKVKIIDFSPAKYE